MNKNQNKELLFSLTKKDLTINYFSGSGAGGQHRNKHQNCVRLQHKDSGTMVVGQSHKERTSNLREAFNNLVKHSSFKVWHCRKVYETLTGKTTKQRVDEAMHPENIQIDFKKNGKWERSQASS